MPGPPPPHTPPSEPDGDGVRVVPKPSRALGRWAWAAAVITLAVVAAWLVLGRSPESGPRPADTPPLAVEHEATATANDAQSKQSMPNATTQEPQAITGDDPDDLAGYFEPGDPEPTGAEVINALREAGVRTGLGAFNPPGTSPPLEGLAVPDDFKLPDGYVRHHQVTDEGVPIEPILMFSPDFVLYDANGKPIAMPENRVVPPELAPPGLPLRRVRIPKP